MYLGEIARNILTALIDAAPKTLLFNGKSSRVLNTHYGLDSSVLSDIEHAWEGPNLKALVFDNPVPSFAQFDTESLTQDYRARLERVRTVASKQLGFDPSQMTLRDAAV